LHNQWDNIQVVSCLGSHVRAVPLLRSFDDNFEDARAHTKLKKRIPSSILSYDQLRDNDPLNSYAKLMQSLREKLDRYQCHDNKRDVPHVSQTVAVQDSS